MQKLALYGVKLALLYQFKSPTNQTALRFTTILGSDFPYAHPTRF